MTESTEIAVLPPRESAISVYSSANGLDPYLAHIRAEIDSFVPDVTTKKGRDAIASIAYKVAKSKTALDNLGKDLVAELKEVPKKIDAERKRMRDMLDLWKDEVRKPLTDFELAEQARVDAIKARIESLNTFKVYGSGGEKQIYIDELKSVKAFVIDESLGEFQAEAARTKDDAIAHLERYIADREKYEAEQAELARLRAEAAAREQKDREERIAREAAEAARIAAEKAAAEERQRLADEQARKELEARAALERAQREKAEAEAEALRQQQEAERAAAKAKQDAIDAAARAEAEKQAAIEAERKRQAEEADQQRLEEERRAKNKAHAKAINNQVLEDMINSGCSEDCAKAIITAIARGQIRHTTINY